MALDDAKKSGYNKAGKVLLVFAALCFFTTLFQDHNTKTVTKTLPATGGELGPIRTQKPNRVFKIAINQNVSVNAFSSVEGEVLDANKNYLFGFGNELWAEAGRDAEGYWSESKTNMSHKFTLKKPGEYHIKITSTPRNPADIGTMNITVTQKAASSLYHFILAIISAIAAAGLLAVANLNLEDMV